MDNSFISTAIHGRWHLLNRTRNGRLRNLSTIETIIAFLAIFRLGHRVLFLSPYLKPSVIGRLLDKAGSSAVIDGTDTRDGLARLGYTVVALETVESLGGDLVGGTERELR